MNGGGADTTPRGKGRRRLVRGPSRRVKRGAGSDRRHESRFSSYERSPQPEPDHPRRLHLTLRGLDRINLGNMFSSPAFQPDRQIFAFTSVSGPASYGDTVSLYVDGSLRQTVTVTEGIPTGLTQRVACQTRTIKVEIVVLDGKKSVSVQKVRSPAARTRLRWNLGAYGFYSRANVFSWNAWDGIAGVVRARCLSRQMSL